MNQEIEVLETIDKYVRGELNTEQIDDLWSQFLLEPEYYGWFEVELMLKSQQAEDEKLSEMTNLVAG